MDILELLDTARTATVRAGRLVRQLSFEPRDLAVKGFRDLVTDADFAAQQVITSLIRQRFPDHGFIAEEEDQALPRQGRFRWIIDPIDGTTNYSRGQPNFAISVGVVEDDHILAGAIYDPARDELFSAALGQGSILNDVPIRVSQVDILDWVVLGLDWGHSRHDRQSTLDALNLLAHEVQTIRAIGSATLALAWIAAGRLDAYVNYHMAPWDLAAGTLIVQEAGGAISDTAGMPIPFPAYSPCLASNGHLHDALLAIL